MTAHLEPTVSDRGLRYWPPVPCTYAGRVDGEVEVHDSSSADVDAVWITLRDSSGASMTKHVLVADAVRLGEQLVALAGENGREQDDVT